MHFQDTIGTAFSLLGPEREHICRVHFNGFSATVLHSRGFAHLLLERNVDLVD